EGGSGGAVIGLVDPGGSYRQGTRGDIGSGGGRSVGRVVGRVGAAEGDAADTNGLGRADVLIGEAGGGIAGRESVAAEAIIRKGDRGASSAIISLISTGGTDAQ